MAQTTESPKQNVINKLTEAYEALEDLSYYTEDTELEDMGEALLEMRSKVRLINENE